MNFVFKNLFKCRLVLKYKKTFPKFITFYSSDKPFTIIVEGNVGCGKTTFLNNFERNSNFLTLYEPIEEWKNVKGIDLMNLFYNDLKTWSFSFQTYVFLTMMKIHETKTNKPFKIMERSIYSGRYVFIENLYKLNLITQPELAVLDEWFQWLVSTNCAKVDLIVYLRTNPEVAYERILKRGREGETLPFEYVTKIHELYENWLIKKNNSFCHAPVWCIDANQDLQTIKNDFDYFEYQAMQHI